MDYEKALDQARTLLSSEHRHEHPQEVGASCQEALTLCQSVIDFYSQPKEFRLVPLALAYSYKGIAQGHLGEYESAVLSFMDVVNLPSGQTRLPINNADDYRQVGAISLMVSNYRSAAKYFKGAAESSSPSDPTYWSSVSSYGLALVHMGETEGLDYLNQAVKNSPEDLRVRRDRIRAFEHMGNIRTAYREAQHGLALEQKHGHPFIILHALDGVVLSNMAKPEKAIVPFVESLELPFKYDAPNHDVRYAKNKAIQGLAKLADSSSSAADALDRFAA